MIKGKFKQFVNRLSMLTAGLPAVAVLLVLLAAGACHSTESLAQVQVAVERMASGFDNPVGLVSAGDERLFVIEQRGTIQILYPDGSVAPEPFLDITGPVGPAQGEQGLLGLAFAPGFPGDPRFYVNYTGESGDTFVSRFGLLPGDPGKGDPQSEEILLTVDQPFGNHNGGHLAFGPDGYLYIGLGDGGSGGDPQNNSQNLLTLLGKMLRIDPASGTPYGIPPGNPFVGQPSALPEIWAWGLRNPWRYSFDRATGDLWIGDVGQNAWEEIDLQPAGSGAGWNYGWRCYEGDAPYNTAGCAAPEAYVFPVHVYGRESGCSVTGGFVYRGARYPQLAGQYLFGDFCTGRMWTLANNGGTWTAADQGVLVPGLSSYGEDAAGELYAVSHVGQIFRITAVGGPPTPTRTPSPSPTPSPTPTLGPTAAPSSSPVPGPELAVELAVTSAIVRSGDRFAVSAEIRNDGGLVTDAPVVFMLALNGAYWFWPSWAYYAPPMATGFDFQRLDLPPDATAIGVVPLFTWLGGPDSPLDLAMFGAVLTPDFRALRSALATVGWRYEP